MTKLVGKKKLTVVLAAIFILLAVTLCGAFDHRLTASAAAAEQDKTGLGYSINAATSAYLDVENIRDGSPVFDTAWLKTQLANANKLTINSTNTYSFNTSSFEDMAKAASASLDFSNSVKGSYDIFTAGTKNGFVFSPEVSCKTMLSQYYYALNCDIKRYSYSLPNYSSDLSDYKNNLNPVYLSNLAKLFNGSMRYEDFFNTYGTHVIAKGIYGGKLNLYYGAVSNQLDVGGIFSSKITSALNAGISGMGSTSASFSFDLDSATNFKYGARSESFRSIAVGGEPFSITNIGQFSSCYVNWYNTVTSSPSLISTANDGLIPLWKLLPDKYASYENNFFIEYNNYVNKINSELYLNYLPAKKEEIFLESGFLRYATCKITDSGRFNQQCDLISLPQVYGYSAQVLKSSGYSKVDVQVRFNMREIDAGYQYVMLYKNALKDNAYLIVESDPYEYGGTSVKTTFGTVVFSFNDLSLNSLIEYEQLAIRYGASGSSRDDWENKDLNVFIKFKK